MRAVLAALVIFFVGAAFGSVASHRSCPCDPKTTDCKAACTDCKCPIVEK